MKRKVAILSSRFPYPIEKGDKLRTFHFIKQLSAFYDIHLICVNPELPPKNDRKLVEKYCESVHVFRLAKWQQYESLIFRLFSNLPYQVAYFYNKSIAKKIRTKLALINPDLVYAQLIRSSPYLDDWTGVKAIDYMDAFSMNMRREAKFKPWWSRWIYNYESSKLKRYEQKLASKYRLKTVISEADKEILGPHVGLMSVINNGIDTEYFRAKVNHKPNFEICFVGNMGYAPNELAAIFLVEKVLPSLTKGAKVLIAGARPTRAVRKLASDRVEVTGWVNDIREAYSSGKIFVAPIFSGAGQQNKLLEAMSMGVPCITTSQVANGLGRNDEKYFLIANTKREFVKKINNLLTDKVLYDKLKTQARKWVQEEWSWSSRGVELAKLIDNNIG